MNPMTCRTMLCHTNRPQTLFRLPLPLLHVSLAVTGTQEGVDRFAPYSAAMHRTAPRSAA